MSKSSLLSSSECCSEGMHNELDVEKALVLLSAKPTDDTLQVVPIKDTWQWQRLVSSMD
jgi:hypothetical protein